MDALLDLGGQGLVWVLLPVSPGRELAKAADTLLVPLQHAVPSSPPCGVSGPGATGLTVQESTNRQTLYPIQDWEEGRAKSYREVLTLHNNLQMCHLMLFKKQENGRSRLGKETNMPV